MIEVDFHEYDLLYHAMNYRGAASHHAEAMWQELQSCVDRIVQMERTQCKAEIDRWIKSGMLKGNGCDETAQRNGLILASNLISERISRK